MLGFRDRQGSRPQIRDVAFEHADVRESAGRQKSDRRGEDRGGGGSFRDLHLYHTSGHIKLATPSLLDT